MTRGPRSATIEGNAVEIQCNKMQRIAARLRGSGCALVLVDAGGKLVYFAVSLSGKGSAPLYVGPMPRRMCLAGGDAIAAQLTRIPFSEHILSKIMRCDSARECLGPRVAT